MFPSLGLFYITFLAFIAIEKPALIDAVSIKVSTKDLTIQLGSNSSFEISLNENPSPYIGLNFTYDNEGIVKHLDDSQEFTPNKTKLLYNVEPIKAGKVTIMAHTFGDNITDSEDFVRVSVQHSAALSVLSAVIGWLYFAAWSVSFYPQTFSNFRRKSVIGLNFDFVGLNITGFLFYSLFNVGLYFIPAVQTEYLQKNPTSMIPVEINDVVFALHATLATAIQIGQCFFYERGDQRVSLIAQILLGAFWSGGFVFLIVTVAGASHYSPWLTFLYYFSYVKLGITLIKYMPQAFFNFKRKSTEGWSIGNILLDFTGGILSLLQMFINAYNFDDWESLFGNLTKFGLGMFSILFDILFMVQHYCLYRSSTGSTESLLSAA